MKSPLILVIDDSPTIRKMVECHLSQAGYRVETASDADRGLEMATTLRPDLILLDHQLPGTTGDEVCKRLLASEATARVPVLVSSALRSRAFTHYADFSNVIDQLPKPFTPELLKSGVANALQTGALVVQAQRTGCAMPEAMGEDQDAALEGKSDLIPFRCVLDFLTNIHKDGRLTLEQGRDRVRFALAGGRVQAVFSPTIATDRLVEFLPPDLADLAPLLAVTLGEHQEASMSGLVKLLEKSLSDPRRLRALLRFQSSVLTYWVLTGEPGRFTFDPHSATPPMFQAFPLQSSLPALAVEGARRCVSPDVRGALTTTLFLRHSPRGGNVDRAGLGPLEVRFHTLLDGHGSLATIAQKAGMDVADAAAVAIGLELVGQVERKSPSAGAAVLFLEDDPEVVKMIQRALGNEGEGHQVRHVRDRVAAQLLMRHNPFALVLLPLNSPEQESFYQSLKEHSPAATRFVGLARIDEETQLDRLDRLRLDGIVNEPVTETDLRATVRQLLQVQALSEVK